MKSNKSPSEVLLEVEIILRERNEDYDSAHIKMGTIMKELYGNFNPFEDNMEEIDRISFTLIFYIVGKIARFVNSSHTHIDSINDICGYAAMLSSELQNRGNRNEP